MCDSILLRSITGRMYGESVPVVATSIVIHGVHRNCSNVG